MTCGFLIQLVFWFINVEVEQETSAPPPKKILDPPLLLFKEAVYKKSMSLIKLLMNRNLSLNFPLNKLGDVNCCTSRGKLFHNTLPTYFIKFSTGLRNSELVFCFFIMFLYFSFCFIFSSFLFLKYY